MESFGRMMRETHGSNYPRKVLRIWFMWSLWRSIHAPPTSSTPARGICHTNLPTADKPGNQLKPESSMIPISLRLISIRTIRITSSLPRAVVYTKASPGVRVGRRFKAFPRNRDVLARYFNIHQYREWYLPEPLKVSGGQKKE